MSHWEDRAKEIIDEESKSDYEIAQEIQRIVDEMNEDIENEINRFIQDMQLMKVFHLLRLRRKLTQSMFKCSNRKQNSMLRIKILAIKLMLN